MRAILLSILLITLSFGNLLGGPLSPAPDSVEVLDQFESLYRYQRYFIGGQPDVEELQWLHDQGVTRIINLRSEEENEEFADESFNEKRAARKMGFTYESIPVQGYSGYNPGNLAALLEAAGQEEKVLIHCASGGRATQFFMAYLVKQGYPLDRAVDIGKQIRYSVPLEQLLGIEVRMFEKVPEQPEAPEAHKPQVMQ
jgi:protein tyrosine phosphatase (PTP) superfamily phosphohydrolase (DUF442 family)